MIELHGVKYYSPVDISKNLPVTLDDVLKFIDSGQLSSCLIDGQVYVCEEDMLDFFKAKPAESSTG